MPQKVFLNHLNLDLGQPSQLFVPQRQSFKDRHLTQKVQETPVRGVHLFPQGTATHIMLKGEGVSSNSNANMITHVSNVQNLIKPTCVLKTNQTMKRNSLPTPVKFEALEKQLVGFDKDKLDLLRSGFKEGFKFFFDGTETSLESRNSKSALLNPEAVTKKLQNEFDMGRIAGTFRDKPLRGNQRKGNTRSIPFTPQSQLPLQY